MDYAGLILEVVFFVLGLYLYLFAIGKLKASEQKARLRAETFRQKNEKWLRIIALALMAVMAVNIYLHILQMAK
jgi:ABC-type nickel/cobalt efflux system permease component RcnA